jgi:hypothetical protein
MCGSPWIRNQVRRQGLPLDALGLDFYHLDALGLGQR